MKVRGDEISVHNKMWVGIDQSYTGFAVTVVWDTGYRTTCRKLEGKGVERLKDAQKIVGGLCTLQPVDVAIEGYAFGATQTAHMAGELGGAIRLTLDQYGYTPLVVAPAALKKYAIGKGNAKKDEVILGVYKNWGVEFSDNNMADSYVLARIAQGEGRNNAQRDVVEAVRKARVAG